MYEKRFYREDMKSDNLTSFTIIDQESDLFISAKCDLREEAKFYLHNYRNEIREYGSNNEDFLKSLKPIDVGESAPTIVKHMCRAAELAGVGPMAAVAGAISQYVGTKLLNFTDEIIIENGGDIFIKTNKERKILIYAGQSKFSKKIALNIHPEDTPMGICTSAGTIGHSLSFGKADAVVVMSKDTLLADATATSMGNMVKEANDIEKAINFGKGIEGIEGILIIIGDRMGAWGTIEITSP